MHSTMSTAVLPVESCARQTRHMLSSPIYCLVWHPQSGAQGDEGDMPPACAFRLSDTHVVQTLRTLFMMPT